MHKALTLLGQEQGDPERRLYPPRLTLSAGAYRSEETEQRLGEGGFKSQIHSKGQRGKPLSAHKKRLNRLRSTVRARVEHVFGFQHNSMGGKLIRTIGLARAKTKIALRNLTYNIMRYLQLERRKSGNRFARAT